MLSSSVSSVSADTPLAISASNISFKYHERQVLSQCDLEVPVGAKLLLLGRSGCGKSTLINIISRVYQPLEGGHVELFGNNLNDLVLHEHMLMMEQMPVVFAGTYRDNMTLGMQHVTDEEIRDACVKASTWTEVQDLGNGKGLGADVGFRGKLLSGGERQRLCLARVLLRKRPIILLDEPVSAQDPSSVENIQEALSAELVPTPDMIASHMKGSPTMPLTVIASTHNMKLMEHATHIAYLANGRIIESGTKHDVLARKGHVYRRLVSQDGLYVDQKGRAVVTPNRLKQIWLFSNVREESLRALSALFITRNLSANDELFREGSDAGSMYLVVSGQIAMKVVSHKAEAADAHPETEPGGAVPGDEDGAGENGSSGHGGDSGDSEGGDKKEGGSSAGDPDASLSAKRTVFLAGDEVGVSGVVDDSMVWPGTAVCGSLKAVVLELMQSDLERLIEDDEGLAESVGETMQELRRMRSPQKLCQQWFFHGAPYDALDKVGAAFEPAVYNKDAVLCDSPRDPCATMSLVVLGSVSVIRGSDDVQISERIGQGAVIGATEMLPPPAANTSEAAIRSRQGILRKARATEFTVVLELLRENFCDLMVQVPAIRKAYERNQGLWVTAVSPPALRQASLMFGACPTELLALFAPLWEISVESEGTVLCDTNLNEDKCVIVLDGAVHVHSRRRDQSEDIDMYDEIGPGRVINDERLLGPLTAQDRELVVSAEVTGGPALILTLTRSAFIGCVMRANLTDGTTVPRSRRQLPYPIPDLQRLAHRRARLLTTAGLRAAEVVPGGMDDENLKLVALTMRTRTITKQGAVVLAGDSGAVTARDQLVSRRGHKRGSAPALRGPSRKQLGVEDPELDEGTRRTLLALDWQLPECIYVLLRGELNCECLDGTHATLKQGDSFCTPLSSGHGQLPAGMRTVVYARRSADAEAVATQLVELNVGAASSEAAERKRLAEKRMAELQAERDELKLRLTVQEGKLFEMETRLGLRIRREPRSMWLWARRQLRISLALGVMPNADARQSSGSLEAQLAFVREQMLHYDQLVIKRTADLKALIAKWGELQPELFAGEEAFKIDLEPDDLSLSRLEEAAQQVDGLFELRKAKQDELVDELERLMSRFNMSSTLQEAVRSQLMNKQLDSESFQKLLATLNEQRLGLEEPMRAVQVRLQTVWKRLHLPESTCAPYRWEAGLGQEGAPRAPLTEAFFLKCEEEAHKLELVAERLQPLLTTPNMPILSMALALIHDTLCLPAEAADERSSDLTTAAEELQQRLDAERHAESQGVEARIALFRDREAALQSRLAQVESDERHATSRAVKVETTHRLTKAVHAFEAEAIEARKRDEMEQANVVALSEAEQRRRTDVYLERHSRCASLVDQCRNCLRMLHAPADLAQGFEKRIAAAIGDPPASPKLATELHIRRLNAALQDLESAAERVQMRCDSDGLFVAMRAVMAEKGIGTRELMKQIVVCGAEASESQGGGVLGSLHINMNNIYLASLQAWSRRVGIAFTADGLSFFAQKAGMDVRKLQEGKPLNIDRTIYAFDKVIATPLAV